MNRMQRMVLAGAALLIAFMVLFPPTQVQYQDGVTYGGYRFLFSLTGILMVAWGQLLTQIVAVAFMAVLLAFGLRGK